MTLKDVNPKLKVLLAMGGWNAGSLDYSKMVSTKSSRTIFINSTISWLRNHNFDGLDMDWEYPAMRGGKPEDKDNFILLLQVIPSYTAGCQESGIPNISSTDFLSNP